MEGQDRFIGSFTHELKTPMTSILGYADLLRRGTLSPEEQASAADYIFSEGKRLERLSLKLLDLYLAQHQQPALVPTAPGEILQDLADHLAPGLAREGLRSPRRVVLGCACWSRTCSAPAVKPGGQQPESPGEGGPDRPDLYHDGNRLPASPWRTTAGGCPRRCWPTSPRPFTGWTSPGRGPRGRRAGAGLCERIAVLHGGAIHFASTPGQGTTVTVSLEGGRP